jgi:hypothetical protein
MKKLLFLTLMILTARNGFSLGGTISSSGGGSGGISTVYTDTATITGVGSLIDPLKANPSSVTLQGNNVSISGLNTSTISLQNQVNDKVSKTGDTMTGSLFLTGASTMTIDGDGFAVNGSSFVVSRIDPFARPNLWYYPPSSFFRLGSNSNDGDPIDSDSEGMVIWKPSLNQGVRIKADRFGLTTAQDSGIYSFRVDNSAFYYRNFNADYLIYAVLASSAVAIGQNSIQAGMRLSVYGNVYSTGTIYAKFSGDGSLLTNLPASVSTAPIHATAFNYTLSAGTTFYAFKNSYATTLQKISLTIQAVGSAGASTWTCGDGVNELSLSSNDTYSVGSYIEATGTANISASQKVSCYIKTSTQVTPPTGIIEIEYISQ